MINPENNLCARVKGTSAESTESCASERGSQSQPVTSTGSKHACEEVNNTH